MHHLQRNEWVRSIYIEGQVGWGLVGETCRPNFQRSQLRRSGDQWPKSDRGLRHTGSRHRHCFSSRLLGIYRERYAKFLSIQLLILFCLTLYPNYICKTSGMLNWMSQDLFHDLHWGWIHGGRLVDGWVWWVDSCVGFHSFCFHHRNFSGVRCWW